MDLSNCLCCVLFTHTPTPPTPHHICLSAVCSSRCVGELRIIVKDWCVCSAGGGEGEGDSCQLYTYRMSDFVPSIKSPLIYYIMILGSLFINVYNE